MPSRTSALARARVGWRRCPCRRNDGRRRRSTTMARKNDALDAAGEVDRFPFPATVPGTEHELGQAGRATISSSKDLGQQVGDGERHARERERRYALAGTEGLRSPVAPTEQRGAVRSGPAIDLQAPVLEGQRPAVG